MGKSKKKKAKGVAARPRLLGRGFGARIGVTLGAEPKVADVTMNVNPRHRDDGGFLNGYGDARRARSADPLYGRLLSRRQPFLNRSSCLRQALTDFLGAERFRKFVQHLRNDSR